MSDDDIETIPQPTVVPLPNEVGILAPVDFKPTIERLEGRAIAARKKARVAAMVLATGVYGVVGLLVYQLLPKNTTNPIADLLFSNRGGRQSIEEPLARRVNYHVERLIGAPRYLKESPQSLVFLPPTGEAAAMIQKELKEALVDLEKAVQIADVGKTTEVRSTDIGPIVSTSVLSLGAVGILVLMIQISVMFIRYHLRLGELYDAQADALRASGGNVSLAYALIQHLSPNAIEVGKSPSSVYEKALDAIQAVAKK